MANKTRRKSRLHLENGMHTKRSENVTPVCGGLHGPVVPEDLTLCKDPLGLCVHLCVYVSVDLTVYSSRLSLGVGFTLPHIGLATYLTNNRNKMTPLC
jgi:hypothetical protein